jgi:capsule polysaccharide export protein KpsE/RkpR
MSPSIPTASREEHVTINIPLNERGETATIKPANWVVRTTLLWEHRRILIRVTAVALVLSLGIAFSIPKQYRSATRIMPPDQQGAGGLAMAALASKGGLGGIGSLLGGLIGGHTSTALFVDLLHSGTVSGHLIERFNLQKVYHNRYLIDTAKHLARCTTVTDDKKSGVITIMVEDTDPVRARDLTQGYLDELNRLVTQTSTSSAHQERLFIERRLHSVEADLEQAQIELSEFSSRNSTIDIKEQTRAMVDAASRIQAEVLVEQAGLDSLRQIYGDGNIRVHETEARIASLQGELNRMSGTSAPLAAGVALGSQSATDANGKENELYPPLRQLPRLAVPYADLYRRVRVQETVFELLTQQYEMSRIEEAKDVPVVSVIDPPGIPEKKFFPPRLIVALLLTAFTFGAASTLLLLREQWRSVSVDDPRKVLALKMLSSVRDANPWGRNGGSQ